MSDVVKRLRTATLNDAPAAMRAGADEIERLRRGTLTEQDIEDITNALEDVYPDAPSVGGQLVGTIRQKRDVHEAEVLAHEIAAKDQVAKAARIAELEAEVKRLMRDTGRERQAAIDTAIDFWREEPGEGESRPTESQIAEEWGQRMSRRLQEPTP